MNITLLKSYSKNRIKICGQYSKAGSEAPSTSGRHGEDPEFYAPTCSDRLNLGFIHPATFPILHSALSYGDPPDPTLFST